MSLLERVTSALFGGSADKEAVADRDLVTELVETIVEAVEPRIRMRSGYQAELAEGVRITIAHLRELGRFPLDPIVLSAEAWDADSHVHAFFARAADVTACISQSGDVRRFFDQHPASSEAFALLGMKRNERQVQAPGERIGPIPEDIARTVADFSEHRLLAPAPDEVQARLDIGRRIVQRLAQLALVRILATEQRGKSLQMHQAYLLMKWRMLQHARNGMQVLVSDPASIDAQMAAVDRELKETTESYYEAKRSLSTLDGYIDHINAVLSQPEQQVGIERVHIHASLPGAKDAGPAADQRASELELTDLVIGEGRRATIALVRIPRDALDLSASVEPTSS